MIKKVFASVLMLIIFLSAIKNVEAGHLEEILQRGKFFKDNNFSYIFLDDDKTGILVIDPENEYSAICKCFGGTVIKISADSEYYINPMDMIEDYGLDEDDDPELTPLSTKKEKALKKKSDYIL